MDALKKIQKAKVDMIFNDQFFATIVLGLHLIKDNNIPTMCTDGRVIWYNPGFVDKLTQDETRAVLKHELYHIIFLHHTRKGKDKEDQKWNIACDYKVNQYLVRENEKLPKGFLLDKRYDNMDVETIYYLLPDMPEKPNSGNGGKTGGKPGGEFANGSCRMGEVKQVDPKDINRVEENVKIEIARAAKAAKKAGKLPAGLEELIKDLLDPKVPWTLYLREWMSRRVYEYSWKSPNRRFVYNGLYLPSTRDTNTGKIVFAIDSSGSMTKKFLQRAWTELISILTDLDMEVVVVSCDTKPYHLGTYTKGDIPKTLTVKGRGGTMFTPLFEWVYENLLDDIDGLIYVSDMECNDYPKFHPSFPVLWLVTNSGNFTPPPFGEWIKPE